MQLLYFMTHAFKIAICKLLVCESDFFSAICIALEGKKKAASFALKNLKKIETLNTRLNQMTTSRDSLAIYLLVFFKA